ncbi:protein FAR1-RELATED SEQUENCE 3-like [Humulus lupulus]|uniref:protein FAR1-RELATED SEQUENCE 3-like n=1 Tax=Humulus lupulus TaxID=3486 RepID=UPI002B40088C|nr:protein FAR1-RELATED SEQUENCE 3-like [Humulus lupulus]
MGFSVRKDDVKCVEDIVTMRRWVCSNEGFRREIFIDMPERQRRPRVVTRTGCQMAFRAGQTVLSQMQWLPKLESMETYAEGALGYLDCAIRKDPHQFVDYQCDEENRLSNLFWADEYSRRDYTAFGEVLAFDTTYKTNKYNKPLIILLGVNHHFGSCVFGLGLLLDESVPTYCWMLTKFLK